MELDTTFPKSIATAIEDHAKGREKILACLPGVIACEAVAAHFRKPGQDEWSGPRASVGWQSGQLQGALLFMDIERAEEITPVLKEFGKLGWHRKKDAQTADYPELQRRSFTLVHAGFVGEIIFSAFFRGEVCKFVEVGRETKPLYELRCEVGE